MPRQGPAAAGDPGDGAGRFAVGDLLDEVVAAAAEVGREDLSQRLAEARGRFARTDTIVCVVGEFKQGKSALINALLSVDVCPVDDDLATMAVTVVRWGEPRRRSSGGGSTAELTVDAVPADGSLVTLGSDTGEQLGPDLRGVFLGSEGTLGITTKITVRLMRTPESVRTLLADFPSVSAAGDVVSDIVAAGIVPAAVEMMDTLAIEAAEKAVHAGYTLGVPAALVVELDGPTAECDVQFEQVKRICEEHGCTRLHIAGSTDERAAIWRGRKSAFAAVGRISPDYFVQDGVVPRTRLAEVLGRIAEMGEAAGLRVANVFHAGDGNLHPLVLYSAAAGETERGEHLSSQIAELCVELGGSLSGEHGIGTDKACSMPKMFSRGRSGRDGPGPLGVRPGPVVQPGQAAAHSAVVW